MRDAMERLVAGQPYKGTLCLSGLRPAQAPPEEGAAFLTAGRALWLRSAAYISFQRADIWPFIALPGFGRAIFFILFSGFPSIFV